MQFKNEEKSDAASSVVTKLEHILERINRPLQEIKPILERIKAIADENIDDLRTELVKDKLKALLATTNNGKNPNLATTVQTRANMFSLTFNEIVN